MQSARFRSTLLVIAFSFLMACFWAQNLKLDQRLLRAQYQDFRMAETIYLPPNEVLKVLAMGYEPLVADLVFMQANAYFANHLLYDRKYDWLDNYVGAITGYCRDRVGRRLDITPDQCNDSGSGDWIDGLFPFNPRVYLWASQVIKFAPLLTDTIIDKSIYYGSTGIHYCPDSWELYFDVGFNLYFEYRDKPDEVRAAQKREAMDYFSLAANLPGSDVDPNFVAGTLWNKDETERAIQQVYLTYYHATDRQRKEMRTRIRAYGEKQLADLFEGEEKSWQEDFPYVPQNLYHVLGRPRLALQNQGDGQND